MAETNQQIYPTVVGYFSSEKAAEAAIRALREAGFSRDQIGMAGYSSEDGFTVEDNRATRSSSSGTKENKPGFWQRVRGLFEDEGSAATNDRSGRGDFAYRESSYDYDAADFHRSFGSNLPEERSQYFNDRFSREPNGVLVTVEAGERTVEAESILVSNGGDTGRDISSWLDQRGRTQSQVQGAEQTTAIPGSPSQRIQLYGEVLRVHRDRIQRGEVRLRKETTSETRSVQVPVTREELVVERVPVSGEKAAPGAEIGQESEVRIPLSEDRVSVEKEPVVREEVRVGKREVTNVETRDEQVRREELRVDDSTQRKAS